MPTCCCGSVPSMRVHFTNTLPLARQSDVRCVSVLRPIERTTNHIAFIMGGRTRQLARIIREQPIIIGVIADVVVCVAVVEPTNDATPNASAPSIQSAQHGSRHMSLNNAPSNAQIPHITLVKRNFHCCAEDVAAMPQCCRRFHSMFGNNIEQHIHGRTLTINNTHPRA